MAEDKVALQREFEQSGYGASQSTPPYPSPGSSAPYSTGSQQNPGYAPPASQGFQQPQAAGQPPYPTKMPEIEFTGNASDLSPEEGDGVAPSAPPLSLSDMPSAPPGYDQVGAFGGASAPVPPPPSYEEVTAAERGEIRAGTGFVNKDEAREILRNWADHKCCYGTGPANGMVMDDPEPASAFHFILETFSEGRSTAWTHVPYTGTMIDGPQNGTAPLPWNISVPIPERFVTTKVDVEVPHTAELRTCHHCHGMGHVTCPRCHGRGHVRCVSCGGAGGHHRTRHVDGREERYYESCHQCHGRGRNRCHTCHARGRITCPTCQGRCQLKWFIELTVLFANHKEDFIYEASDLPNDLIRDAKGDVVVQEEGLRVAPLTQFPQKAVNEASERLIVKHDQQFSAERRHAQRQTVRAVAVNVVHAEVGAKDVTFWIYGHGHRVWAPRYPATCCWSCAACDCQSCTIL